MTSTAKGNQESCDTRCNRVMVIALVILSILLIVIAIGFLRSAARKSREAAREAEWDKEIDEIKRGNHARLTISSSDMTSPTFSEKLMKEPVCLKNIEKINIIAFFPEPVSEKNSRFLSHLTNLKKVFICDEGDADVFLKHLQGMESVEEVCIDTTPISREGMQYIASLPNLKKLAMNSGNLNNQGLAALRGHPTLERLQLRGTNVTDDGLVVLIEIPKLRSLALQDWPPISPIGFEHLKKLTNLKKLYLDCKNLDAEMIIDLQKTLPNCKVTTGSI